ncbi:hypothetical protein ASPVEDRAFT_868764 [Aspergillus versicolor CBS 583.65]|uniref:Protein kinase domain-containing protein n=1 Tax=Aspergillus versicolor CBS 583.65 TaxID=1036611 RepID=A0A1L9PW16_ASPVE|nr:uncharacterized protein ASPVEDRAFT_868764 [Aspergillus versicolor CBS 583.65]OJJ05740.1 hypothetical protein ASPVEDRAFT_868764 [Aspergillus versicolor CBS 583.65]
MHKGKIVVSKYRTFKDAGSEIYERVLIIEATWSKISQQLDFLNRICGSLNPEHRDLQQRILLAFHNKLELSVLEVSKLEQSSDSGGSAQRRLRAAKYVLSVKRPLDLVIQRLQAWAAEFDPTWWLILRMADTAIDKEIDSAPSQDQIQGQILAPNDRNYRLEAARHIRDALQANEQSTKGLFLREATLNSADRSDIPFSTSQIITLSVSRKPTSYILDSVDCTRVEDDAVFAKNVRDLALRLEKIDAAAFHLLQCHGVTRTRDPSTKRVTSFNFIFKIPKDCHHHQPQSLRSLLLSQTNPSLTARLELAKQLATALSYVHVLDFVHKNIRPETALVFKSHGLDSSSLAHGFGPLFLVGFKTFRTVDGKSLRLTTADRIENIYQHPERQGRDPSTDHRMQHDIYSLGVCLLEIGLWKSFVAGDSSSPILLSELSSVANIKAHFTALAKECLPSAMGEKYTGVVVNCLTCMEPDNVDFGDEDEFKDEFGIGIGVKYIEKILLQLNEISL